MITVLEAMQTNGLDSETMRRSIRSVDFKKGEIVLRARQSSEHLHVIQSGLVKVYSIGHGSREAVAVIYGKDDMFPLSWILQERKENNYYQAITDCKIVLLPRNILLEHIHKNAEVSLAMCYRILEQYELYASRVDNLEFKYGRERLAYRLLLLAAQFGKKAGGAIVIPRISQNDLAGMINTTRESLSREMSRFERRGVITYQADTITIQNPAELRQEFGEDTE